MTDPLRVLVYGSIDAGVTDALRVGTFVGPLARLGVEVRAWSSFAGDLLNGGGAAAGGQAPGGAGARTPDGSAPDAWAADELRSLGLTALAWADVVLFRRWRSTHPVCTACETVFATEPELAAHVRASGHQTMVPDLVLPSLVELLASHPELLAGRAIVYDTDDDVLDYPDWTGFGPASRRERGLVRQILGLADLVTTTTPVLASRLAPLTGAPVRVIRNALDPAWYAGPREPRPPEELRVVYHGVPVRLRDYAVARPAVDEAARALPALRRIWLGAANEPRVAACVDEARPWVDGLAGFARALASAGPDVGLAPLLDEPFNRAKSELHWLEYALAGAPAIVSGFDGPGPYDVVRDRIDGLVARSPAHWRLHLRALAASVGLRAELAGRARERVLAEYTVAARADEWSDAYRWAAGRAGRAPASGPRFAV